MGGRFRVCLFDSDSEELIRNGFFGNRVGQNHEMEPIELALVEVGSLVSFVVGWLDQLFPVFVLRHFPGQKVFVQPWLDVVHVRLDRVVEWELVKYDYRGLGF